MIKNYLNKELMFIGLEAKNRNQLFDELANSFIEKKYVTQEYGEKLNEREDNFPTAIELERYSFAIPHTDPEFIKEPFISVITMKDSVKMMRMDDQDEETEVSILFVLGFKDGSEHMGTLRLLIQKLQDEEIVNKIKEIKDVDALYEYLVSVFEEE